MAVEASWGQRRRIGLCPRSGRGAATAAAWGWSPSCGAYVKEIATSVVRAALLLSQGEATSGAMVQFGGGGLSLLREIGYDGDDRRAAIRIVSPLGRRELDAGAV